MRDDWAEWFASVYEDLERTKIPEAYATAFNLVLVRAGLRQAHLFLPLDVGEDSEEGPRTRHVIEIASRIGLRARSTYLGVFFYTNAPLDELSYVPDDEQVARVLGAPCPGALFDAAANDGVSIWLRDPVSGEEQVLLSLFCRDAPGMRAEIAALVARFRDVAGVLTPAPEIWERWAVELDGERRQRLLAALANGDGIPPALFDAMLEDLTDAGFYATRAVVERTCTPEQVGPRQLRTLLVVLLAYGWHSPLSQLTPLPAAEDRAVLGEVRRWERAFLDNLGLGSHFAPT